jgi:DNA-directed RNA polymerase beta subunit
VAIGMQGLFDGDLSAPPPAAAAPQPPQMRGFDDVRTQRQQIYDNALRGVSGIRPVENDRFRIEIANPRYAREFAPTLAEEKKAMLERRSLTRPIKAALRLIDKTTGAAVDEVETTVAHIPHLTGRGIVLRNGTVWGARNQNRLRPGVFVLRQQNGGIKAQVNARPGSGRGFDVELDPRTGIFKLGVGQSSTRLYPALRAMGVSDDDIKEAWGEDLYKKNWRPPGGQDAQDLRKLVGKLGRKSDLDIAPEALGAKLREVIERVEVDEEVTARTLGEGHSTYGIKPLMATTAKMLRRARDEVGDDNRDSQAYQSFHSLEDFLEERLKRPHEGLRKLLWQATRDGKLGKVPSGIFDKNLDSIYTSGLMHSVEDTNPFEIIDSRQTITRLGEGGISSNQAVPRSARGVQPSYFGIIDPIRAPEGQNIGVDMRVTDGALKGDDGRLYFKVRGRDGELKTLSALQAADTPIAFPGERQRAEDRDLYRFHLKTENPEDPEDIVVDLRWLTEDEELAKEIRERAIGDPEPLPPMVRAIEGDDITWKKLDEVEYELPSATGMFSRLSNLVPMIQGSKSQRALMGARMFAQSLPLQNPEAPLVQSADAEGNSLYDAMGEWLGAVRAKAPGRVSKVTPDFVEVVYEGGHRERHDLYNHYPLARKTMLHNTPLVAEGETIKPGQVLAKSNFTDASGAAAPGRNLRVAYMVGEGGTYEDGFKISESAAKKLTSHHSYKQDVEIDDTIHSTKKEDYQVIFTGRWKPEQLANIDDEGAIREGSTVNPGDPLILAVGKKEPKAGRVVGSSPRSKFADKTEIWDHSAPGVVTDVVKTAKGIRVHVESYEPMTPGSKLTARYGNKGVIAEIVPDGEMPEDETGQPVDVLVNALGVVSRANPSVLAETLLAKVARKTGKPYKIGAFDTEDLIDFALSEARKHGVEELETLRDPKTGRRISDVFTGEQFMMRLHHTAEAKVAARDTGGYTYDESPAKGGDEGSKRIAMLDTHSLLSYGATGVLKDAKLIRGQRNDDFWRALKLGQTPSVPQESFANRHFLSLLKGAGVNVRDRGGRQQLAPMTDADIDRLAQHSIDSAETLDFDTMRPKDGGLFDLAKTGGVDGLHFSKIVLPTKIPNPVMEEPIIRILGLTKNRFMDVLAGKADLNGKTGPEAVEAALGAINIDREIANRVEAVKTGSRSKRDTHVKALNFLTGLKAMELKPTDLLISRVPVIPPKFRPILRVGKMDIINDANYLYNDLIQARTNFDDAKSTFGDAGEEYLTLYNAAKAVTGLGDPINPEHVEQNVKGLLANAIGIGESPKFARFQRKVIGQAVDNVGRGVIVPDPELDMDQISIPKPMAFKILRPFVIRRLVRNGYKAADAVKAVRDETPAAERELIREMEARPVYWNRAPALHRYNYVGAWARLAKGNEIGLPQVTEPGANADHDGDMVNVHVPVSSEAVRDVIEKMMPSRNLWHPSNFDVHLKPDKDYLAGLYLATKLKADKEPRRFASREDAFKAYLRGEIGVADPVIIQGTKRE